MWHMHDVGAGWWLLMTLGMIAFWGLVIWGLVTLVRDTPVGRRLDGRTAEPSAEAILKRRLAQGEITPEEYRRLRDTLRDTV
jgi:putative membrane protein